MANSNVNYMTQTLRFEVTGEREELVLSRVKQKVNALEPGITLRNKADGTVIGGSSRSETPPVAVSEALQQMDFETAIEKDEEDELRRPSSACYSGSRSCWLEYSCHWKDGFPLLCL